MALNYPAVKVRRVKPPDYEKELSLRKAELKREEHPNLLMFPQRDVEVKLDEFKYKTEEFPITMDEIRVPSQLFTKDCLDFYSSPWDVVVYNNDKYGGSYEMLVDDEMRLALPHVVFERDQVEAERMHREETDSSQQKKLTKSGFMYKGLFPNDTGLGLSIKNYRKRWFELVGGPNYGGYSLVYYRDGKSSSVKGTVNLEICTDIRPNTKYRTWGFDLLTEDDKVFYPLATETQKDMEEWLTVLGQALGLIEENDNEPIDTSKYALKYRNDTLRGSIKSSTPLHPELLARWNEKTDADNYQKRQSDRNDLFSLYPDLMYNSLISSHSSLPSSPSPPKEDSTSLHIKVTCENLSLKLTLSKQGKQQLLEPFYVTLALYDAANSIKLSEDFHIDVTNIDMCNPQTDSDNLMKLAKLTNQALFSVTCPNPEVYLVARIEKVLQGTISSCADPYIKPGDSYKTADRLSRSFTLVYERLAGYRMPFAWAAKPLFASDELNVFTTLDPLFKQEREKLSDNDLLRMLADFKSINKLKLQVIPGHLSVNISKFTPSHSDLVFTPSFMKLSSPAAAPKTNVCLQVREFPSFAKQTLAPPHTSLVHHLYIYPLSLKYDAQKQFNKARNIAVCVQFKESDIGDSEPLKVIYDSHGPSSSFSDEIFTCEASSAVLYHCTTPAFYSEIKVALPIRLHRRHHLLFIFKHIICDNNTKSKSSLKQNTESIIGYSWLPLLEQDGSIIASNEPKSLIVATTLPSGYLSTTREDLKKKNIPIPDIRWVDTHNNKPRPIFTINTTLDSTIYSQDFIISTFFSMCDVISSGKPVDVNDIKNTIESLEDMELESYQFLPVLLNRLFNFMSQSFDYVEDVKMNIIMIVLSLVDNVSSHGISHILQGYINYMFSTSTDPISNRSVHDDVIKLLLDCAKTDEDKHQTLLTHIWFFFEVTIKSMAQYLATSENEQSSRKTRFLDDLSSNLLELLELLIKLACMNETSGQAAVGSIARFVKKLLSFMDRGVVFDIINVCMKAFDALDNEFTSSLRLDYLSIICQHEHFIPLNLPFPTQAILTLFYLNDEYCRKHYLTGLLLTELDVLLQCGRVDVRSKAIDIVKNLLAKLDSDDRYTSPGQRSRIATLLFPLIPLIIKYSTRFYKPSLLQHMEPSPSDPAITQTPVHSAIASSPLSLIPLLLGDPEQQTQSPDVHPHPLAKKSSVLSFGSSSKVKGSAEATNPLDVSMTSLATPSGTPPPFDDLQDEGRSEKWEEPVAVGNMGRSLLTLQETRDLLMCFLFVLKNIDEDVLYNWWQQCMDSPPLPRSRTFSFSNASNEDNLSDQTELEIFFDVLKQCIDTFEYSGRLAITKKWSGKTALLKQLETSYIQSSSTASRRTLGPHTRSKTGSTDMLSAIDHLRDEQLDLYIKSEGVLSLEVGLVILDVLETFAKQFKDYLNNEIDGNEEINKKFFSVAIKLLDTNSSKTLQSHMFATIRSFTYKFSNVLFTGSADYCGSLCYQILKYCNSNIARTRDEAIALLYLLMRENFNFSKKRNFTRVGLQTTIALSKISESHIQYSQGHLRKSLGIIVNYADNDSNVKSTTFPSEVKELMIRLRTVLSSTAQMKEHRNDPEKLLDLYYSLAQSYAHSHELRQTWLDSLSERHISYDNHIEAAQCYLHIAGLIYEYLKLTGKHPSGCSVISDKISRNVGIDERSLELSKTSEQQTYSERDLMMPLEKAFDQLEKSNHYELLTSVFVLLLPFYEREKDFKKLTDMYGRLYESHKKIMSVMKTGRRYLGTYYRVAFYGELFGDDNQKQYIYKEPNVTPLSVLTQRLLKLYTKKFGSDVVQILHESGKIDTGSLDVENKCYIQITHVVPYHDETDLTTRTTRFERENQISCFMFDSPFSKGGSGQGGVGSQWMRKTVVTTSHWFPYIVKRIPIIHSETFELSPIEVAVETMKRKREELEVELEREETDLVKLQLLLQGSISAQVNQGVQEYANVFLKDSGKKYELKHIKCLREIYRSYMELCEIALERHDQLISKEQQLLQHEMMWKFHQMKDQILPLIDPHKKRLVTHTSDISSLSRSTISPIDRPITTFITPSPTTL